MIALTFLETYQKHNIYFLMNLKYYHDKIGEKSDRTQVSIKINESLSQRYMKIFCINLCVKVCLFTITEKKNLMSIRSIK